jgi:membrane protein DedA with SNARE-associated domain
VAGALAVDGDINGAPVLAVALACLISDFFWFRAGRISASASCACCADFAVARLLRQPDGRQFQALGAEGADRRQVHPRF